MRKRLDLTPEKALVFRITHRNNVPWILSNGQWSRNSGHLDPDFVTIGNTDLIEGRVNKLVPIPPGGVLGDYVPFYFTPCSPMLLNIVTGTTVQRREKVEIVVLISSLHAVVEHERPFVYTDRHAYLQYLSEKNYSNNLDDLPRMIPWNLLQSRDFRRDPEDPEKSERYQAEALVYEHLPAEALLGIATYNEEVADRMRKWSNEYGLNLHVHVRPGWFFE